MATATMSAGHDSTMPVLVTMMLFSLLQRFALTPRGGRDAAVIEEHQAGDSTIRGDREVPDAGELPRLVGAVSLDRDLHHALGAVVDEAQRNHAAARIRRRVEAVNLLASTQELSA